MVPANYVGELYSRLSAVETDIRNLQKMRDEDARQQQARHEENQGQMGEIRKDTQEILLWKANLTGRAAIIGSIVVLIVGIITKHWL